MPPRSARDPGRLLLACVLGLTVTGCAGTFRVPLDLPPGQRPVLGRLDLSGFEVREATIEIVRDDGGFEESVHAGLGHRDFAIALPPGRYRLVRLRAMRDRRRLRDYLIWELRLTFEVGLEPAVYIGTLRVRSRLGHAPDLQVLDEYDDTLGVLRAQYSNIPNDVGRSLLRPG